MKIINIIITILILGCTNTSQKDIFDIARRGNISELKNILNTNHNLINKENNSGYTPLILASYYENNKIVSYLIKNGATIDKISNLGTALMAASYKSNNKSAKLLIDNNANVNLSDSKGTTALHYACFNQNLELVKLLISKKANPLIKDLKGKTPLDYSIENNNIEIIKILNLKTN